MLEKTSKSVLIIIASLFFNNNAFAQEIKTYDKFPQVNNVNEELLPLHVPNEIGGMYLTENNLILQMISLSSNSDIVFQIYSYPDLKKKGEFGTLKEFWFVRSNPASTGKNSITLADNDKLKHITFQNSQPAITCTSIDSTFTDVILLKDSVLCKEADFGDDYELRFYKRDGSFKKVSDFPEELQPRFKNNYLRYGAYNRLLAGKPDGERMVQFYRYIRRYKIFNHNGDLVSDNLLRIQPSHEKPALNEEEQLVHPIATFTTNNYIYTLNLDNRYEYAPNERTPLNIQVFDWDGKPVKQFILPKEINIRSFVVDEDRNLIYGADFDQIYKFKL